MEKLGTEYGGWYVPLNMSLNSNSIVYSGGVGEDISFDIKLQSKYNCNIYLIDPTYKAIKHYDEMKKYYIDVNSQCITGNIQNDYLNCIKYDKPNFDKIYYLNIGLWNKDETLKFFKQTNPEYVSQSLVENMFGNEYDLINTKTIKQLMEQNGHDHIDLLKLDIEGAEIKVINNMLDENIYPKYVLIEFDLFLKRKDNDNSTHRVIQRLLDNNYSILKDDNCNITFSRNN